jgi:hypothetical protein
MIRSYGKVLAIGHRGIANLFDGPVEIQEKVDGSQFSFGRYDGELVCRSRNTVLNDPPEKMFTKAMDAVRNMALHDGWTYRGEYLQKPCHNSLCYERYPDKHVIVFDIDRGIEDYLDSKERYLECKRLGLEAIPVLDTCQITDTESLLAYLDKISVLGGVKIEGIVVKNYRLFGEDGHALKGKFVSEQFKEIHRKEWKAKNPNASDIKRTIGESLQTEARWHKAVQHMREDGTLTDSPKDIGPLIKAINQDVLDECTDDIKERLFKWAWKDIARVLCHGMPQWYKEQLLKNAFKDTP